MSATHPVDREATTATRWAWVSLLGFVPSSVLSFAVGEGLMSALGHPSGGAQPSAWVALAAGIPALVVFSLPAVSAVLLGRRAARLGDDRARLPMLLAVAGAGVFVLVNGLSALTIWRG